MNCMKNIAELSEYKVADLEELYLPFRLHPGLAQASSICFHICLQIFFQYQETEVVCSLSLKRK